MKCKVEKPATLQEFAPHKQCRDQIGSYCRPCRRIISKASKDRHRTRINVERRAIYAVENGAAHKQRERRRAELFPFRVTAEHLRKGIWERARSRGLPIAPELGTKTYIIAWLQRQPNCECCGIGFDLGPKNGVKKDASPSFDQRIPGAGYELANVALICWRCNNIKRNYSAEDLRIVAAWMDRMNHGMTQADIQTVWGDEIGKFGGAPLLARCAP
jgi:hypothetical protein